MASLTPEVSNMLGIDAGSAAGAAPAAVDSTAPMVADPGSYAGVMGAGGDTASADSFAGLSGDATGGAGGLWDSVKNSGIGQWVGNNPAQAGLLANSMLTALKGQKLPSAANAALNSSSAEVQQAQGILASGGTTSPGWAGQKAAIDQQVDANLANAIEQAKQSAANSGMGGSNSAVVQQQINRLQQQAATQKQAMYTQALNSIVSSAVGELSGGNATLSSIAQMQMQQSHGAQAAAAQTAQLALMLSKMSGSGSGSTRTGGP
jgi:hypothetical protein